MADSDKDRALSAALSQIERQFGKGSMMRLGDREQGGAIHIHWVTGFGHRVGYWGIA